MFVLEDIEAQEGTDRWKRWKRHDLFLSKREKDDKSQYTCFSACSVGMYTDKIVYILFSATLDAAGQERVKCRKLYYISSHYNISFIFPSMHPINKYICIGFECDKHVIFSRSIDSCALPTTRKNNPFDQTCPSDTRAAQMLLFKRKKSFLFAQRIHYLLLN